MDLSLLTEFVLVLLASCAAVAACLFAARLCRLHAVVNRTAKFFTSAADDGPSIFVRLAFSLVGVMLVITVVALGLVAQPIWAATVLVLLCSGMTAFVISGNRSPARAELRAHRQDARRAPFKKAA